MDEAKPQNNGEEQTTSRELNSEDNYDREERYEAEQGKVAREAGYALDLALTILFTLLSVAFIYVPVLNESIIRPVLGFSMALFVPGYALIAALFPRKRDISGLERIVLSFTLSICVVPLIGYGLNFTPWGIRLDPIVVSLSIFTILCTLIAYWRRHKLEGDNRFYVDFSGMLRELKGEAGANKSTLDKMLNVVLVISVTLSVCAIGYMIFTPKQGERYTEFYILGPNSTASEYPLNFTLGERKPIMVYVANHEGGDVSYDLVIALNKSETISQLYSEIVVGNNQTWKKLIEIKPDQLGIRMELQFLLYSDVDRTAPYRECRLWINVTNPLEVNIDQTVKTETNQTKNTELVTNKTI